MAPPKKLSVGEQLSRAEISRLFGGGTRASLPRAGGVVVCGCFDPKLQPKVPEEILVGEGRVGVSSAKLLAEQKTPVPFFLKRGPERWEFIGHFRGVKYSENPREVNANARPAHPGERVTGTVIVEAARRV